MHCRQRNTTGGEKDGRDEIAEICKPDKSSEKSSIVRARRSCCTALTTNLQRTGVKEERMLCMGEVLGYGTKQI